MKGTGMQFVGKNRRNRRFWLKLVKIQKRSGRWFVKLKKPRHLEPRPSTSLTNSQVTLHEILDVQFSLVGISLVGSKF